MVYTQGVSFAGFPIIGADVTITRGTKPGTIRLRIPHDQNISSQAGDLIIQSDGEVVLAGCYPDLSTIRMENRPAGRREFSVLLRDRRLAWSRQTLSGKFNVRRRDNSIEPGTAITAADLADAILVEAGESGGSSIVEAYPPGEWDEAFVSDALDSLSDVLPVFVCRKGDDTYTVQQTGVGDSLPDSEANIHPDYTAALDSGPKTPVIECGKTWFQCGLELEAVGTDTDGADKLPNDLSYKPSMGWEKEWPTLFTRVAPTYRGLALQSVFRRYRIKIPQTTPFGTITSLDDIDLDDRCVVFGTSVQPKAIVDGIYWPKTDHYVNTDQCPMHSDMFWIDKESRTVVFHHPVWKVGTCVAPADLRLFTGFHLRINGEWAREYFTKERVNGTGSKVYKCHHLWRARAYYKGGTGGGGGGWLGGSSSCEEGEYHDNIDYLEPEGQVYANAWAGHWDAVVNKRHRNYAGVWPLSLSGNIQKITMRVGKGESPVTRASQNYEHGAV